MKNICVLLISLFCFGETVYSQNQSNTPNIKRYRVFLEMNHTINSTNSSYDHLELVGGCGSQFNSYVFLGGGTGIHYFNAGTDNVFMIPLFTDFRLNFSKKKITPSIGLKAGYSFHISSDDIYPPFVGGMYLCPSVGLKYRPLNDFVAANFSIAYTIQFMGFKGAYRGLSFIYGFEF
ncbi:MAG: hypothetical protein LBQ73_06090 [Tannerellaceae bacterium]|jgi:hypothetical protein|nr:hypothetical protein [Tannerellaceae bacterium]